MARKLKTFLTQSGFYDLAVAAPSMQAALDAWGFTHNAFHQGFAAQTYDPEIVAATLAAPGIVLKRAVGTSDPFQEHPAPPTSLPASAERPTPKPKKAAPPKSPRKAARAAILSFEKAKAAREKKQARERQVLERRHAARARRVATAKAQLEKARAAHEKRAAALEAERRKLDQRRDAETEAWNATREKLEDAVRAAER
jgi:colicin import membrane protein